MHNGVSGNSHARRDRKKGTDMTQPTSWKSWLADWIASWRTSEKEPRLTSVLAEAPRAREPMGTNLDQRQRRNARRETLYTIIRECMIRASVLSSAYKFKVLTLDPDGQSHLVLVDIRAGALQHVPGGPHALETDLRQLASERAKLTVKSVYWRDIDNQAVKRPAPVAPVAAAASHEEITHDEIAALHQALGDFKRPPGSDAPPNFEPTRPMVRRPYRSDHPLSDTQMGDLE